MSQSVTFQANDPNSLALRPISAISGIVQSTCTNAAAPLASNACVRGFWIESDTANTVIIYLGGSGVTNAGANSLVTLVPGSRVWLGYANTSLFYICAASGTPTYRVLCE